MRYRYLKDPMFAGCVMLYLVNRWILKPFLPNTFSVSYLNDLICIPFWVPIMLFIMRRMRLRKTDLPPQTNEIIIPLILWSIVFEVVLPVIPAFKGLATADPMDILCYTLGACIAAVIWRIRFSCADQRG
jgi:hypothetical protein